MAHRPSLRSNLLRALWPRQWRQGLLLNYEEPDMSKFNSAVKAFALDEDGVTVIEYGLLAAMMAVAIVAAVGLLKEPLNKLFFDVAALIKI